MHLKTQPSLSSGYFLRHSRKQDIQTDHDKVLHMRYARRRKLLFTDNNLPRIILIANICLVTNDR